MKGISVRFDVRRDTQKKAMVNVFIRTNAHERKLYRESLDIDTMGKWKDYKSWMQGNDEFCHTVNAHLLKLSQRITSSYLTIKSTQNREPDGRDVMAAIKDTISIQNRNLIPLLEEYVNVKGLSPATDNVYTQRLRRLLLKFIKHNFTNRDDISIHEVDLSVLNKFEVFLRTSYKKPNGAPLGSSTTMEYIAKMKSIMRYASDMGYVKSYPFDSYKPLLTKTIKEKTIRRRSLTAEDLFTIESGQLADPKLERIRKLFILQSWSGLAYADMKKYPLIAKVIDQDLLGKQALIYNRAKNGELAYTPLFKELEVIINRLDGNIDPGEYSNYLKGIRQMIKSFSVKSNGPKPFGAHTGRHAFGERMLDLGFSLESICRMMGHSSIRLTEKIYAVIDQDKVRTEFNKLQATSVQVAS